MEAIVKKKCGESNLDHTYSCCLTNLWKWWCLGGVEPMFCQCHIPSDVSICSICMLHMWMGFVKEFMQAIDCGYFHMHMLPKKTWFNIVEHGMDLNVNITSTKTTKTTRFPNQNKNKGRPNYNPNHETRKTRTRTQYMKNKNSIRFYYNKAMTRKHTQNWCWTN